MSDMILGATALLAIGYAVFVGPLRLMIRTVLRRLGDVPRMRRWQHPVTWGVAAGAVLAVLLALVVMDVTAAVVTATFALLSFLALMDLAWRWLPLEWTLPLLGLGLLQALTEGALPMALIGGVLGGGLLWALQFMFLKLRGVMALGTGDIWLAAALGILAGPDRITLILCLAALTALAFTALQRADRRKRYGVAYGAHMCVAYVLFFPF
ncbi:prepilin peptidase [Yoonia sp. 2307UL14-13]|uniref:prepilin peptidase n=1 Tax=Yoonia sp. 2307UL14-13 TaxID=3126506 RepID=UPI00309CB136